MIRRWWPFPAALAIIVAAVTTARFSLMSGVWVHAAFVVPFTWCLIAGWRRSLRQRGPWSWIGLGLILVVTAVAGEVVQYLTPLHWVDAWGVLWNLCGMAVGLAVWWAVSAFRRWLASRQPVAR